ncbi:hypothetical protein JCM6882_000199 [Rhodosporidiobolus microsporus]
MRPASGFRLGPGTRPVLPRRIAKPSTSPGYATFAPARPSLARPPRLSLHPSLLLVHLGGITATSCLIPVIGARYSSSRAVEAAEAEQRQQQEEPAVQPVPFDYPIQQPFPLKYQLFLLSNNLRRQVAASPVDAAFTLRQLHLVDQVPQLHLPDQTRHHPPSHDLANLAPERWVWRIPAAAALHSILRILSNPSSRSDPRLSETLLPIAVTIAEHSLRFDSLVWSTVLQARGHGGAIEWERLMAKEKHQVEGDGMAEEPVAMTRLAKRPRVRSTAPDAAMWEEGYKRLAEKARRIKSGAPQNRALPAKASAALPCSEDELPDVAPLAAYLHPASSLPTRTLDRLFLHLAGPAPVRKQPHVSTALSLSLSLSALYRRRSLAALEASFSLALFHHRPDFAARFWADLYRETSLRGGHRAAQRQLSLLLRQLSSVLRPEQKSFEAVPPRRILAAVSVLARTLDEAWAAATQKGEEPLPALGELLRLLAAFPPAPLPSGFQAGTPRRRHARMHERVAKMVKEVLRRVIEDVVQREVRLAGSRVSVGSAFDANAEQKHPLPLNILDYNTLISFSLLKLQSADLAVLILERMSENGFRPSPATHNIVFAALEAGSSSFADVLRRQMSNQHTLPIFLAHLTRTASFDEVERIVFQLLPELDQRAQSSRSSGHSAAAAAEDDSTPRQPFASSLPPALPPPLTGRTPYLYTTLLSCVVRSGRIGLAERIFRNARWAAERSREPLQEGGPAREGWVLPQHAYTVMLQLYAAEVKRGQQLERRDAAQAEGEQAQQKDEIESFSTPYVRGWGRHALRVFLLGERRAQLAEQLGTSASSPLFDTSLSSSLSSSADANDPSAHARRRQHRTMDLPAFLRSEAAPIVAIWELEGGSKGPELESLRKAMASSQARSALRVLFPAAARAQGVGRGEAPRTTAREELRELGRRSWRRGERAGKDERRERERERGETVRRWEVGRRAKREEQEKRLEGKKEAAVEV